MKIVAGSLFFGLSVFLHSIELISSQPNPAQPASLGELFPQSKGFHFPPIQILNQEQVNAYPEFKTLNGHPMVGPVATYRYYKRGNIIFGCEKEGDDDIKILGLLYDLKYLFAVFDTKNRQWYTLTFDELVQLGVDRSLRLVQAHDQAHAEKHAINHQANPNAHKEASIAAYLPTRRYEEHFRIRALFSEAEGPPAVKEYYNHKYNEEYARQMRISPGGPSGV